MQLRSAAFPSRACNCIFDEVIIKTLNKTSDTYASDVASKNERSVVYPHRSTIAISNLLNIILPVNDFYGFINIADDSTIVTHKLCLIAILLLLKIS